MTTEEYEPGKWRPAMADEQEYREQVWHAMNRHPKVCGRVSEERLDDCTDAVMSEVVGPLIERLRQAESWRDLFRERWDEARKRAADRDAQLARAVVLPDDAAEQIVDDIQALLRALLGVLGLSVPGGGHE